MDGLEEKVIFQMKASRILQRIHNVSSMQCKTGHQNTQMLIAVCFNRIISQKAGKLDPSHLQTHFMAPSVENEEMNRQKENIDNACTKHTGLVL